MKVLFLFLLVASSLIFIYDKTNLKQVSNNLEPNYEGLYNLHLIPNCDVPSVPNDKIIAYSQDKILVESIFGCVYERSR